MVRDRPRQASKQERRGKPHPPSPASEAPNQLAGILAAIRRHRLTLAVAILLSPCLAALAVSRLPPRYTATGTLIYEPEDYSPRDLQSILRVDPASDTLMASQAEVIRSLPAAEALQRRYNLDRNPAFNPALKPPGPLARVLSPIFGTPKPPSAEATRQTVLARVEAAIDAQALHGSRVVAISFTADEPGLAAAAANFLMQRYIDDQLEAKFEAVRRASQWLEARVADLRQEVQSAEDRIAAYRAKEGLVQGVQAGLDTEQVSRLNNELVQARAELAQAEGRLEAARGRAGAAALAAVAPNVTALRNQLEQASAQLQAQLTREGPKHPDAISLQNQLVDLQRAVAGETARVIAATEADVRASRAKVAALEDGLKQAQTREDTNAQAQVPLNAMQREADAARTMLTTVLEREQQTVQQTAIEKPDARIISPALPPLSPSAPKSMLIVALASVAGVLFGATFVYLLEVTNRTLRSGEEVRNKLGIPCFALIPALSRRTLGRYRFEEYAAQKPMSPLAEQLRAVRASLWLGSLTPRVVAITAARPAEGKTALAIALGRSMAMAGQDICIVDCDIRERAIARLLRPEREGGLSDVLLGLMPLEDALRTDRLTGMKYLPAGTRQSNSFGLFMSDGMAALVRQLSEKFDAVLLDVPPVLAMADARVAARLADATLLCARWNHTPVHVVAHSLELLEDAQAHVCGVALTRVDARLHQHSGYADSDIYHSRYAGYYSD